MKTVLKKMLIRQPSSLRTDEGFTLVELLVVVIIIGVLAAISLPAYLNLTAGAKQTEAKQNIAAIMTAQQLWIDEKSSDHYPASIDELAVGVVKGSGLTDATSSSIYTYSISHATDQLSAGANPKDILLKTYTGGVRSFQNDAHQMTWYSVSCESIAANETLSAPTPSGTATNATLSCPSGFKAIKISGK